MVLVCVHIDSEQQGVVCTLVCVYIDSEEQADAYVCLRCIAQGLFLMSATSGWWCAVCFV